MLYDQLLHHQVDINKLKSLPEDSKEYRKAFSDLRLSLGRYAIQDFRNAKNGDSLYFYKKEYYLRLVISFVLLFFAFLIFAFIIIFFGDKDTSTNENILICVLLAVSLILSFVALGIALTIQTPTDEYLHSAINRFLAENSNSESAENI